MSHWYDSTPKKSRRKRDSNPGSSALEADALPLGQRGGPKEREETKGTTKQKMARRQNKEGGSHMEQESIRQKTIEDIDGGLHPAVDGKSLRELLGILNRDDITNEEMKARFGNAIGPYEDLLTSVKRHKLKWYGHVKRSSGLAKTVLQGTVQGGRRRGRQRKRWEDNIKEWTGPEWNILLRKAENHEEWRKLVVNSTVVPQRSARLRDR